MAEILLGVSGGIAAYKAVDVLRLLQHRGHVVTVVMTRAAQRFVGPSTFAALSGRPVGVDLFGAEERPGYGHLDLARKADLFVIAPATANTLATLAGGHSHGLLGAVHLAYDGPLLVAPAMNTYMYEHPATVDNIALLRRRGVRVIDPGVGLLADGDIGVGRLADPVEIVAAVERELGAGGRLTGRRVLVSAGGTREPIDPVRYIGNRSSGRMGWAVAEQAAARGAEVTVLAANVDLPRRADITYIDTPTAADMERAAAEHFPQCDLLVMAAAVADFAPRRTWAGKIDKRDRDLGDGLTLDLGPTPDIVSGLAAGRTGQVVVGFAAEHGPAGLERARAKRRRKGLDLIVHNDVSVEGIGFGSPVNEVVIIGPESEERLERMDKAACAGRILDAATPLLGPPR